MPHHLTFTPSDTGTITVRDARVLGETMARLDRSVDRSGRGNFEGVLLDSQLGGLCLVTTSGQTLVRTFHEADGRLPLTFLPREEANALAAWLRKRDTGLVSEPQCHVKLERLLVNDGTARLRASVDRERHDAVPIFQWTATTGTPGSSEMVWPKYQAIFADRQPRWRAVVDRVAFANLLKQAKQTRGRSRWPKHPVFLSPAGSALAVAAQGGQTVADVVALSDRPAPEDPMWGFDLENLAAILQAFKDPRWRWVVLELPMDLEARLAYVRPLEYHPKPWNPDVALDNRTMAAVGLLDPKFAVADDPPEEKTVAKKTASEDNTFRTSGSVVEIRLPRSHDAQVTQEGARIVVTILPRGDSLTTPAGPAAAVPMDVAAALAPDRLKDLGRDALAKLCAQRKISPEGNAAVLRQRLGVHYLLMGSPQPENGECDLLPTGKGLDTGAVWVIPAGPKNHPHNVGQRARIAILHGLDPQELLDRGEEALEGYYP